MRNLITPLLVCVVASFASFSQAAVIVQYNFGPDQPGETLSATTLGANVSAGSFAHTGSGAAAFTPHAGSGRAYLATGWADVSFTDYFSFLVTVDAGFLLNVTDVTFDSQRSADGPTESGVAWVQGPLTVIETGLATSTVWTTHVADNSVPSGLTGAVEFRIYAKGASQDNGPWIVDDVTLNGEVVPIPEPGALLMLGAGAGLTLALRKHRRSCASNREKRL